MRLNIRVQLDTGGEVYLEGENLSAEDVAEVFEMLASKCVSSDIDDANVREQR